MNKLESKPITQSAPSGSKWARMILPSVMMGLFVAAPKTDAAEKLTPLPLPAIMQTPVAGKGEPKPLTATGRMSFEDGEYTLNVETRADWDYFRTVLQSPRTTDLDVELSFSEMGPFKGHFTNRQFIYSEFSKELCGFTRGVAIIGRTNEGYVAYFAKNMFSSKMKTGYADLKLPANLLDQGFTPMMTCREDKKAYLLLLLKEGVPVGHRIYDENFKIVQSEGVQPESNEDEIILHSQ